MEVVGELSAASQELLNGWSCGIVVALNGPLSKSTGNIGDFMLPSRHSFSMISTAVMMEGNAFLWRRSRGFSGDTRWNNCTGLQHVCRFSLDNIARTHLQIWKCKHFCLKNLLVWIVLDRFIFQMPNDGMNGLPIRHYSTFGQPFR